MPTSCRSRQDGQDESLAGWCPDIPDHPTSYANSVPFALMATLVVALPSVIRVRNCRLNAGSSVLVSIASIMRPPLSGSVQREAMSFTTSSL